MWVATWTAHLGDWRIGVRTDDAEVAAGIVERLGAALVPDAAPAPGFAVVASPSASGSGPRPLPVLRHGACDVVRSRSTERLVLALEDHLLDAAGIDRPACSLASSAVVAGGAAVLVPHRWIRLGGVEPRLAAAGWSVADAPTIGFDPTTRRVSGRGWSPGERRAGSFDVPVAGGWLDATTASRWPDTPTGAVAALADLLRVREAADAQHALEGLVDLAPSMRRGVVEGSEARLVVEAVASMLAG